VERAFHLYKDQKLASEAALLAALIAWDLKDRKKALEMASQADKHKSQNYYSIYTNLFGLYGEMESGPESRTSPIGYSSWTRRTRAWCRTSWRVTPS